MPDQMVTFHAPVLTFTCGATLPLNHQTISMLRGAGVEKLLFEQCHKCGGSHEMDMPDVSRTAVTVSVPGLSTGGLLIPGKPGGNGKRGQG